MRNRVTEGVELLIDFGQRGHLPLQLQIEVLDFSFSFPEGGVVAGKLFGLLLDLFTFGIEFDKDPHLRSQHLWHNRT